MAYNISMQFIALKHFEEEVSELLTTDSYGLLLNYITSNPGAGVVIPGLGGIRKMRWALPPHGKRGGARVIYFWKRSAEEIYLLDIYAKNVKDDLTLAERNALVQFIENEVKK